MDNTATRNYMKTQRMPSVRLLLFVLIAACPVLAEGTLDHLIQEKKISSSVFVLKTDEDSQRRISITGSPAANADISWLHPGKANLLVFCYSQNRFVEKVDGSVVAVKGSCYNVQKIGKVDFVLISDKIIRLDKVIDELRRNKSIGPK